MCQATSKKAGVDSEILHLERPVLMFSNFPTIFSLVNFNKYLRVVVNIAFPVQVKVFVTLPALDSWEGLAGQVALPPEQSYYQCLSVILSAWPSDMTNE